MHHSSASRSQPGSMPSSSGHLGLAGNNNDNDDDSQSVPLDEPSRSHRSSNSNSTPAAASRHDKMDDKIEKARQALALSGYPNPSMDDIQRVVEQVALLEEEAAAAADATRARGASSTSASTSKRSGGGSAADNGEPGVVNDHNNNIHAGKHNGRGASPSPVAQHSGGGSSSRSGGRHSQPQPQQQQQRHGSSARRSAASTATRSASRPAWDDNTNVVNIPQRATHAGVMHHPQSRHLLQPPPAMRSARSSGSNPNNNNSNSMLSAPVRLERYVKRFEKALNRFYDEHADMFTDPPPRYHHPLPGGEEVVARASSGNGNNEDDYEDGEGEGLCCWGPYAPRGQHGLAGRVLEMPLRAAQPAAGRTHRQSANVIYNVTGDQRYRFRPSAAATAAGGGSAPGIVPQRAFQNLYNTQPLQSRRQGKSAHTVSYLNADGSTLKHKADPVRRGQQMRMLWERDGFLTQRDRRREMWYVRQATMAHDDFREDK